MEQQDLQKRLLLALVLSLVVLISFGYLFPQNSLKADQNGTVATSVNTTTAPKSSNLKSAPVTPNVSSAPSTSQTKVSTPSQDEIITTITADNFIIKIDKFGRVKSTQLLKDKYKNEDGGYLELFDSSKTLPLEVRFSDTAINNEAFEVAYSASMGEISLRDTPQILTLTQKLSTVTVTKKITFYADGHYDLELSTDKPVEFF
ncbi:MAG: membrane protein insertase YidC, partial [Sulfurovum sp.]|nr:membrane protein insertase YidC [Sulfurovum sp.]